MPNRATLWQQVFGIGLLVVVSLGGLVAASWWSRQMEEQEWSRQCRELRGVIVALEMDLSSLAIGPDYGQVAEVRRMCTELRVLVSEMPAGNDGDELRRYFEGGYESHHRKRVARIAARYKDLKRIGRNGR